MSGELAALSGNWLGDNVSSTTTTYTSNAASSSSTFYLQGNTLSYPWYVQPYTVTYTDHRPIRLTLSEVERLRHAAKRDAKLKAILAKFTDQIAIVVDFE